MIDDSGTVLLDTSTSANGSNIAVYASSNVAAASVTIVNSTVASLYAETVRVGGAYGVVSAKNSVLGQNANNPTCVGHIVSNGYNLTPDSSCGLTAPTDLQGVPTGLGGVAANGGPTQTKLPLAGSAVIDSGDPACTGPDQRGSVRPHGGACDRGAVEL
jgi:hypothetical protein